MGARLCTFTMPLLLVCGGGCARWNAAPSASADMLLRPPQPFSDTVTLEILFVRAPSGQEALSDSLWRAVDEQHLDRDVRRRLLENGFRAGLVAGQIPAELADLLNQSEAEPAQEQSKEQSNLNQAALDAEPRVRRRLLQLRGGRRGEILASSVLDRLPLLIRSEDGRLNGRTFENAQAMFLVRTALDDQQRVTLSLTPQIQHGQPQQQWNAGEGMLRLEMSRPQEVLNDLRIDAALSPGQMFIMTSLPDRPGSLGHYYFIDERPEGPQQRLLAIRLAQMPPAELFGEEP